MRGFTLVEILVVTAIIGLLAGMGFVVSRSSQDSLKLDRVAQKTAQDIGKARSFAIATREITCTSGALSGYGVYFDSSNPTSYILYAECNDPDVYNVNLGADGYQAGADEMLETVQLEQGIVVKLLQPDPFYVTFSPPDPVITLGTGGNGRIILAPENAPASGYEFWPTGIFSSGHKTPRMDGYCDSTAASVECGSYPYVALPADSIPNMVRWSWFTSGGPRSMQFKTFPIYSPSKVITISDKGVIQVQ